MKTLATVAIVGFLGAVAQPHLAQAAGMPELPWPAELGVCSTCLAIAGLAILRVIPQSLERSAKTHAAAIRDMGQQTSKSIDEMKDEISGLRTDVNRGQDSQLGFMREIIRQGGGS